MRSVVTGSIGFDHVLLIDCELPDAVQVGQGPWDLNVPVSRYSGRLRGGSGANLAYNFAKLGIDTRLVGSAGDDYRDDLCALSALGIDCHAVQIDHRQASPVLVMLIDRRGNQVAAFFAGAMATAVDCPLPVDVNSDDIVVIGPNDPRAMLLYLEACQKRALEYWLVPGPQTLNLQKHVLSAAILGARGIILNQQEFDLALSRSELSLEAICQSGAVVVATKAADGSSVLVDGSWIRIPAVTTIDFVDSVGCGDSFAAGFIYGHESGLSPRRSAEIGSVLAAFTAECAGAQNRHLCLESVTERLDMIFGSPGN